MAEGNGVYIPVYLGTDDAQKQLKKLQGDIAKLETQKVRLSVEIETNDKSLQQLREKAAGLEKEMSQYDAKRDAMMVSSQRVEDIRNEIESIESNNGKLEWYGKENLPAELEKAIEESIRFGEEWESAKQNVAALEKEIENTNAEIKAAEENGARLREKFEGATQETNTLTQASGVLEQKTKDVGSEAAEAGAGAAEAGAKAGMTLGALVAMGRKAYKVFGKVLKGVGSFIKSLNPMTKLAGVAQKAFHRLGMTLRRVFVFSVLTSGARKFREMITKILNANKELSKSLKTLKGAFLTSFQPIFSAIIPILTRLVQWLTTVMMAIARLTAGLFGKTAKQAQASAKALEKEANAAKKATKSLAGIDEINKLDAPSGDSSGATFDAAADDTLDESKGETYLKFLRGITAGVRDLQKAFEDAIPSINGFWGNLYATLSNPDILAEFGFIGTSIAELINIGIQGIDWSTIGATLGLGLKHLIELAYQFLRTVDWKGFGKAISSVVNGAIKNIDWNKFGRTLMEYVLIGFNVLYGAITNLDVKELVGSLGDFFLGALERFVEWLREVNWYQVARKIFEFFHYAITEIDWSEIVKTIFLAFVAGLWARWQIIAAAVTERVKTFLDLVRKLLGLVIGDEASTVFFDFGKRLMQGLADGITAAWNAVKKALESVWNFIKGIINGLLSGVETMANGLIRAINAIIRALNRLSFKIPDWVPIYGGKQWGLHLSEISTISIPRLATGAVIPPNREFLATLGDNKRETEVVSPLSTMKEALLEALEASGLGNQNVAVYVDGRELFDIIVGRNNAEVMRTGRTRLAT